MGDCKEPTPAPNPSCKSPSPPAPPPMRDCSLPYLEHSRNIPERIISLEGNVAEHEKAIGMLEMLVRESMKAQPLLEAAKAYALRWKAVKAGGVNAFDQYQLAEACLCKQAIDYATKLT